MTPEVAAEMRALVLAGKARRAIGKRYGFAEATVWGHTRDLKVGGPTSDQLRARHGATLRVQRTERLFAACNRALAEARP